MKNKIGLLILFSTTVIYAQTGADVGMSYLKIGVDARASAMGDAYTSLAEDAAATYWNPAGLANASSNSIILMHNSWIQGVNHEFAAVQLFQGRHNVAVSLNMMFVSGIELRGERATDQPDGETSAHNVNLGITYATDIGANWKIGGQFKYLYEKYYLESAAGWAVDFGVMKKNILPDLSIGAVVQNIGSMGTLRNESTKLPLSLRTGVSYRLPWRFLENNPLLAADFYYVNDDISRLGLGAEAGIYNNFVLRAGYIFGSESFGITTGLGVKFGSYNISYAFVPFQYDLGNSHRFSIAIMFN